MDFSELLVKVTSLVIAIKRNHRMKHPSDEGGLRDGLNFPFPGKIISKVLGSHHMTVNLWARNGPENLNSFQDLSFHVLVIIAIKILALK